MKLIQAQFVMSFIVSSLGKVHGSLARAGKVRGQTPKVWSVVVRKLMLCVMLLISGLFECQLSVSPWSVMTLALNLAMNLITEHVDAAWNIQMELKSTVCMTHDTMFVEISQRVFHNTMLFGHVLHIVYRCWSATGLCLSIEKKQTKKQRAC